MPTPFWIRAVVWLAIGLAIVTAAARGLTIDATTLAIVGGEVSAVGVLLGAFDRLLWRAAPLRWLPWPGKPPLLRGTWRMRFTIDQETPGVSSAEECCYLVIRQTSSQIGARTLFADGLSRSMAAVLTKEDGEHAVWFFYDFRPNQDISEPARIGGAMLRVLAGPMELHGNYWNQFGGRGKLDGESRSPRLYDDFGRAREGVY